MSQMERRASNGIFFRIEGRDEPLLAALNCVERDDFSWNRHLAPAFGWSMIFSEDRCPSRIKSGTGFFGIML
jgi:hypothetical protein